MSSEDWTGIVVPLAVVVAGAYIATVGFNEAWYSWQYDVPSSSVHVKPKPKDCDFISAPLGSKNCRYKPIVYVLNAEGVAIDGEIKMKFSNDTSTGKQIVSYDDGKNWTWYSGGALPSLKPASVNVSWIKVSD